MLAGCTSQGFVVIWDIQSGKGSWSKDNLMTRAANRDSLIYVKVFVSPSRI